MPTFNMPNPENLTTAEGAVTYMNDLTAVDSVPILGPIILIGIFFLFFYTLIQARNEMNISAVSSLWVTTVISFFLTLIPDMISGEIVLGLIILTAISTLLLFKDG